MLLPQVRSMSAGGAWSRVKLDGRVAAPQADVIRTAVEQVFGARGRLVDRDADAPVRCVLVDGSSGSRGHATRKLLGNDQAYSLRIGDRCVEIAAARPLGLRYGLMTLENLLRAGGGRLRQADILDWPELTHRGYMLALVQGHNRYVPEYAFHVVRQLARLKANALYLYLENSFQFDFDPLIGGRRSMTSAQARRLDDYADAHGIEVIPMLNILGHGGETLGLERYRHLAETPADANPHTFLSSQFCPTNPRVQAFVARMLGELAGCFRSPIIHVGGDEAALLGKCPACARAAKNGGVPRIYAGYFNAVAAQARKLGKRIGIWGDMLLNHRPGGKANDRLHTVDLLDKSIVIYDWVYDYPSPESLRYFARRGRRVVASTSTQVFITSAPWIGQEVNQLSFLGDCPAAGVRGGLVTNWTNYMGAHDENWWMIAACGMDIEWTCRKARRGDLAAAFALQRYGLRRPALGKYIELLGSTRGPMYAVMGELGGNNLRQALCRTDNPLRFWRDYVRLLGGGRLRRWGGAIAKARRVWQQVAAEARRIAPRDAYLPLLETPLVTHEHLYRRFLMSVKIESLYKAAAAAQGRDDATMAALLRRAAAAAETHRRDFPPVIRALQALTDLCGNESYSILKVRRTMENLRALAAFLRHLAKGGRPLPAFPDLHNVLMERPINPFWVNREDEWADAPRAFQRYSVAGEPWKFGSVDRRREAGRKSDR